MQRGQWSEQPTCVLPPATDDQTQKLKGHITALAPTFNFKTDANAVGLRKHPVLQQVLQDHTRSGLYIWQYSRLPQQLPNLTLTSSFCFVETEQTEALSEVAGAYASTWHQVAVLGSDSDAPNIPRVTSFCWLPAPVPQESLQQADTGGQKHYAAYSQVARFEPCYGFAPSLLKRNASGMKGSRTCKAVWVRDVVQCQECWKPRAVFAATALPAVYKDMDKPADYATTQLQIACIDDPQFVCGAQLYPRIPPLA
jgi:hypothetical protein